MNFQDATSQFPAGVSPKVNELLASVECGYHKVNGNLATFYHHHTGMVKIMTALTGSTNTSINYLVHAWSMWAHHHQIIILFGVLINLIARPRNIAMAFSLFDLLLL